MSDSPAETPADQPDDQPTEQPSEQPADPFAEKERIAKRLARAGVCSRRDGEKMIAEGRVSVNGVLLTSPAVTVCDRDIILVDGKPLPEKEKTRLWRYYKPPGLITAHSDPQGRPTVFSVLPSSLPRVISVGRLDYSSEGLLLLTNDGELARRLELPTTGWARRYRVRVHGTVVEARLASLSKGITIEGIHYGPIQAVLDRQQGSNAWLTVTLREGKNREVRRIMEHMGWTVNRLIRLAYGPFQLGNLEPGTVEEVPGRILREQLGGEPPQGQAKAKPKPAPRNRKTTDSREKKRPDADRRRKP